MVESTKEQGPDWAVYSVVFRVIEAHEPPLHVKALHLGRCLSEFEVAVV